MAEASRKKKKKKKKKKKRKEKRKKEKVPIYFFVNVSPASCYTLRLTFISLPLLSSPPTRGRHAQCFGKIWPRAALAVSL